MAHGARGVWKHIAHAAGAGTSLGPAVVLLALSCGTAKDAQADDRPEVGGGASALPAVDGVGVLADMRAPFAATAQVGYGLTESVIDGEDLHHRAGARLAAGFAPRPWLGLAARIDGRYDAHVGGVEDGEDGFVGQSQLRARSALALSPELRIGAELGVRLPGASDLDRGLDSTSAELQALSSYAPPHAQLWLSALLGFRLDRAHRGVADPSRLSLSDRVALGASDSNALLLGLALSRMFGRFDLLGEWSWDLQVGSQAPAALESPMRLSAGARYFPTGALHVQLIAGVSPSARPDVSATGPLYLIEPRFWITAGVGLYLSAATSPPARARQPAPAPVAKPPTVGAVRGRVIDAAGGAPLAGVSLEVAGREPLISDAQGGFTLSDVAPGTVEVRARAPGFREASASATVVAGRTAPLELALARELPEGQIRGSVRGFDGKPLAARIRIEPIGKVVQPDAEGNFELDVAPGEYTIVVSAPGHQTQQRPALVEHNGVTVIVVELSPAK